MRHQSKCLENPRFRRSLTGEERSEHLRDEAVKDGEEAWPLQVKKLRRDWDSDASQDDRLERCMNEFVSGRTRNR